MFIISSYAVQRIDFENLYNDIDLYVLYYTVKPSSLDNLKYFLLHMCPLSSEILQEIHYKLINDLPLDDDGCKVELIRYIPPDSGMIMFDFRSTFLKDIQEEISQKVSLKIYDC